MFDDTLTAFNLPVVGRVGNRLFKVGRGVSPGGGSLRPTILSGTSPDSRQKRGNHATAARVAPEIEWSVWQGNGLTTDPVRRNRFASGANARAVDGDFGFPGVRE